jgi:hypothetical protein
MVAALRSREQLHEAPGSAGRKAKAILIDDVAFDQFASVGELATERVVPPASFVSLQVAVAALFAH